jgi:hypothetical protein
MVESFNTGMSFHTRLPMASTSPKFHPHRLGRTEVSVDDRASEPEPAPDPLIGRKRGPRRPRFAGVSSADDRQVQTGAIAVSFAIVSRKRWPR